MRLTLLFVLALPFAGPAIRAAEARSDRQIEQAVESSYVFSRVLDSAVDVQVQDGVAVLTGSVRDIDQSRLAEDTAAEAEGVRSVRNRIKVDPSRESSDDWLAVKIRSRLLLKPDVSLTRTRVDVRDGVVTLTGTADSAGQKRRTEEYIRSVAGVREVRNELRVDPSRQASEMREGAGLPTGRTSVAADDREANGGRADDAKLAAQIKFELLSRRVANALQTKVDSRDGRVVITGEVETQADKDVITDVALGIRGVSAVENRMTIKPQ